MPVPLLAFPVPGLVCTFLGLYGGFFRLVGSFACQFGGLTQPGGMLRRGSAFSAWRAYYSCGISSGTECAGSASVAFRATL